MMIEGTNSGNRLNAWIIVAMRPAEKRRYRAMPKDIASAVRADTSPCTIVNRRLAIE